MILANGLYIWYASPDMASPAEAIVLDDQPIRYDLVAFRLAKRPVGHGDSKYRCQRVHKPRPGMSGEIRIPLKWIERGEQLKAAEGRAR